MAVIEVTMMMAVTRLGLVAGHLRIAPRSVIDRRP